MALAHTRELDWHDPTCRRLDYAPIDDYWATCRSCGSSGPVPYAQPPLPLESSFRLLRLLPGNFDEVVRCEIHVDDLRNFPSFSAISYTWADENGDDRELTNISINDRSLQVTKNCDAALRRVRKWSANVYIWIDAICIDQDNDVERGHQVKLMPQIYQQARKVFMYVGEHDADSRKISIDLEAPELAPHLVRSSYQALWYAIKTRKYFTRLWILQEIALAKRAILLCGNSFYDWKNITDCFSGTPEMEQHQHHAVLRFDHSLFTKPNLELFVLDCGKPASAKDPRDKVYGLLGLLPARRIGTVIADYTISTQQLYTEVAIQLAQLHGWAAVLERAGLKNRTLSSLPSWVPDWSSTTNKPGENVTSILTKVESKQILHVPENKIRLKLIPTSQTDQWIVPDSQDDDVDTYMSFGRNDLIYDLLITKEKTISHHQRLRIRLEQLDLQDCSSYVLCEAMQMRKMILVPIEQCISKPSRNSDWATFKRALYESIYYVFEFGHHSGLSWADAEDVCHQRGMIMTELEPLVFRWLEDDIRALAKDILALGDTADSRKSGVYRTRNIFSSLANRVLSLLESVHPIHWREYHFLPLRQAVRSWTDFIHNCRHDNRPWDDKLFSLEDEISSWRDSGLRRCRQPGLRHWKVFKNASCLEQEKYPKSEAAEAWLCHAENLWAEKYPFKGTHDPKDPDHDTPQFDAAMKADSTSPGKVWVGGRKDTQQEEAEEVVVDEEEKEAYSLFKMNDFLWRLLVRRCAVRAQLIDIV
ncbi:hypothetical protein G7054_g11523 [Neopestalotiopsis clavispora]|nr:hypothetical protein G7054_g11523 [Neopestalotiopsis clavispora]